ncbi:hypothetical protein D3C72_1296010 [compost metagenome]
MVGGRAQRGDVAHHRHFTQAGGQAQVFVGAVDAGHHHAVGARLAGGRTGLGIALDQRVGSAIGTGSHRAHGVGVLAGPLVQFTAVVDEHPVRLPAAIGAVELADQLHRRRVARRGPGDSGAVLAPDGTGQGLLGGATTGQAELVAALDGPAQQRPRGIGLLHADQTRTAAVIDGQPQHRLRSWLRPQRQAQRRHQPVHVILAEARDQQGTEARRTAGAHALVLLVVVAGHIVLGIAQRLRHAGARHDAAIAGQFAQYNAQRAGKCTVAVSLGLAVDGHFGLVRTTGSGNIPLGSHAALGHRGHRQAQRKEQGQKQAAAHQDIHWLDVSGGNCCPNTAFAPMRPVKIGDSTPASADARDQQPVFRPFPPHLP